MTNHSVQAQAVLDAFLTQWDVYAVDDARWAIAAALRAVVMEVVLNKYQYADWQMAEIIMQEIQSIADELENHHD